MMGTGFSNPRLFRTDGMILESPPETAVKRVMQTTELLVIGAGPYGLSIAAHAKRSGINVLVTGETMAFWKRHMPRGMLLRSGLDWHLDVAGVHTIEAFLEEKHIPRNSVEPIPVEIFRDYAEWFRQAQKIEVEPSLIRRLRRVDGRFEAERENGETIRADRVVATPGLAPFPYIPSEVAAGLPSDRITHTAELVDFRSVAGKRYLIVGGRQSAFEWAALMVENGAESVDLVFRHDTPRFVTSDWSFTGAMIENTLRVRGWFRRLTADEKAAAQNQFRSAGRLQLEPWLYPRINKKNVRLWPRSSVSGWRIGPGEVIEACLDRGDSLVVDRVLFATGYRVDFSKVAYLEQDGNDRIKLEDGFPVLDEDFQTTLPGLHIAGQGTTRDFGPCFGFVRGCIPSARIIVSCLERSRST
jgi:cation diffusion facilitator CzcD-associated flavoprotein CzcO